MLPSVRVLDDDVGPDDVRRHQVGGELDAGERQLEPFRERLDEKRLAQARDALEQDVAPGEQAGENVCNDVAMTDDHLLYFRAQRLERGDERLNSSVLLAHRGLLS